MTECHILPWIEGQGSKNRGSNWWEDQCAYSVISLLFLLQHDFLKDTAPAIRPPNWVCFYLLIREGCFIPGDANMKLKVPGKHSPPPNWPVHSLITTGPAHPSSLGAHHGRHPGSASLPSYAANHSIAEQEDLLFRLLVGVVLGAGRQGSTNSTPNLTNTKWKRW